MADDGFRSSRHSEVTNLTSFSRAFDVIGNDIIAGNAKALLQIAENLKNELRAQVLAAGLGNSLAKAWQTKKYPADLRSWHPALFVYSKAPIIHDAFNRGDLVTAEATGSQYLAIPTKYVPPRLAMKTNNFRKNGAATESLPKLVEQWFGRKLVFMKGKNGKADWLLMPQAVMGLKGRGWKAASKGRVKKGRKVEALPMFILIKQAKHTKRLDIEGAVETAQRDLMSLIGKS